MWSWPFLNGLKFSQLSLRKFLSKSYYDFQLSIEIKPTPSSLQDLVALVSAYFLVLSACILPDSLWISVILSFHKFVKHIKLPHLGYISLGLHFAYTPPPDFYVAVSVSSVTSSFNFISERFLGAPTPSKLAIHCSRHSYLLITKFFFFGNRTFTFTKNFRTKSSRETGPFPMPRHDSVILKQAYQTIQRKLWMGARDCASRKLYLLKKKKKNAPFTTPGYLTSETLSFFLKSWGYLGKNDWQTCWKWQRRKHFYK